MLNEALNLIAEVTHVPGTTYPGGASASNPVPEQTAYYLPPVGYGIFAFLVLAGLLFAVTRLNIDR